MNTEIQITNNIEAKFFAFLTELVESGCPQYILIEFLDRELGEVLDRFDGSPNVLEEEIAYQLEKILNACGEDAWSYLPDQDELKKAIGCASPEGINEDYLQVKKEANRKTSEKIASLYLEKNPRDLFYGARLLGEDAEEIWSYKKLTEEELNVLRKCSELAKSEECGLGEILESEGHVKLLEKLLEHESPYSLGYLDSIDLEHPLKFSGFAFQSVSAQATLDSEKIIGVDLTDEEYKEILIELLLNSNHYSMNMLVYRKPELAQQIMEHLSYASMDFMFENWEPFVADMKELKEVCEKILNPFKDTLSLFECENPVIKTFVLRHQIVPKYGLFNEYQTHMHFEGRKIVVSNEQYTDNSSGSFESFTIDASVVMKKYGLDTPEEIHPYFKEHYNKVGALEQLRKELLGE